METILKFDRVVLVNELNDKFKKVGECYEIANIFDDSFLLRDAQTRVAVGVISFADFEKCFVHESNYKGWTQWVQFAGYDGQSDCFYRTNRKKTQVKFVTDKVRSEACCCKNDEFNLYFGIQLAYLRCLNKVMTKKSDSFKEEVRRLDKEVVDNTKIINRMIDSLEA